MTTFAERAAERRGRRLASMTPVELREYTLGERQRQRAKAETAEDVARFVALADDEELLVPNKADRVARFEVALGVRSAKWERLPNSDAPQAQHTYTAAVFRKTQKETPTG